MEAIKGTYLAQDGHYNYKLASGKQVAAHRYRWEEKYGEGSLKNKELICLSDDRTNADPSNWKIKDFKGPKPKEFGMHRTMIINGFLYYRLSETKRLAAHRYLWEQQYGKESLKGKNLVCLSDDRSNPDPSNWRMQGGPMKIKRVKKAIGAVKWINSNGFLMYLLPDRKKVPAHRYLWEQQYGKESLKGKYLRCLSEDKTNPDPSNWEVYVKAPKKERIRLPVKIGGIIRNNRYEYVKVARTGDMYKARNRVLWEELHGPIPEGHRLRCLTNNTFDSSPSNWEMVRYNTWKIGEERIYKQDKHTIYVKIAEPNLWQAKQVYIYEKVHGPIPDNYRVIFLDNNRQNFAIENLKCVSPSEYFSGLWEKFRNYPEDLQNLIRGIRQLNRVVNKKNKEHGL